MGKKDKGGFKSLIEHIKQEIISSTGRPVEIREETLLDKILSEDDNVKVGEKENENDGDKEKNDKDSNDGVESPNKKDDEFEKGLLWPPYYHYGDKWWSYFWFVKNPKNLRKVLEEKGKEIDHYEKDCLVLIDKKGNNSPSGDNIVFCDKYPYTHAIWRFIKRTFRFILWLLYVLFGYIWFVVSGNNKEKHNTEGAECKEKENVKRNICDLPIRFFRVFYYGFAGCVANLWRCCGYKKGMLEKKTKQRQVIKFVLYLMLSLISGGIGLLLQLLSFDYEESKTSENNFWKKVNDDTDCIKGTIQEIGLDASRWRKSNAVILFLSFTLFIYLVINIFLFFLRDVVFFQPEMSITDSGVVKMTQPCGVEQYLFVHSSAELWKNTGISVVKDDEIEVYYSGAFYSTIRDMDKSAVLRTPPRYRLMNSRQYGDGCKDDSIVKYCVYNDEKDAHIGQLLLQITPPGQEPKSQVGKSIIDAVDFSDGKYQNLFKANESGTLRIAVNDVYLKKERIKGMLDSINDEHLKRELLNHALYPMTSERLSSQSDALDSIIAKPIRQTLVKYGANSILVNGLFKINEKIQHTHNLIRALVNSNDSDSIRNEYRHVINIIKNEAKDKKLSGKYIYYCIEPLWPSSYNIHNKIYKFVKEGNIIDIDSIIAQIRAKQQLAKVYINCFFKGQGHINIDSITPQISTKPKLLKEGVNINISSIIHQISAKQQQIANVYIDSIFKEKRHINIDSIFPQISAKLQQETIVDIDSIIKKYEINNLVLKDGCAVYVNNPDTEIKRDNLYAILFKYYIPQRDEILKQLDKFLKSSDQLNWEDEAKDFWYSDNAGDLLVSVRVSRNDIPWHMKIVRFIDQKIDRLGKDTQDIRYIIFICVLILLLFLDCHFGAEKNLRLIKGILVELNKQKKLNNNIHKTSKIILPYYDERLSILDNKKSFVGLKIILGLIIGAIVGAIVGVIFGWRMGLAYGMVMGITVLLVIIICKWKVLFCKNYKNIIQKDIDFLKKLKK